MVNVFQDQHPADAMRLDLAREGRTFRLSEHFTLGEFASRDGADMVLVHPATILILEAVRRRYGRAFSPNSAFRTPRHNIRVGGSPRSKHLLGMAVDIAVPGVTPEEVARFAEEIGVGGIGIYPTFVHLDCAGRRRWRG